MTTDSRSPRQILLPFRLSIDPMERLLVANFKSDPEFEGLEPQVFDDPINGRGMRVLRYRKNGKVDVYWQPGVIVDRSTLAVGSGIEDFIETPIEPARFEITERSLDLHVAFTDAQGRKVELRVHERIQGKRGFQMLAPVGADVEKPQRLIIVFMPDIDLVRRSGSLVEGRIGDRTLRPASLPILLNWQRVWFVRYVPNPVIAALNPPMSKPLMIEMSASGRAEVDGMMIIADEKGSVSSVSAGIEPCHVKLDFSPGFPNLPDIPDRGISTGKWKIHVAGVIITGGTYSALRDGNRAAVELDITENWKPSGLPLSMEIFTRAVPVFRTWPATYRWQGVVELGVEQVMSGTWERKEGKMK